MIASLLTCQRCSRADALDAPEPLHRYHPTYVCPRCTADDQRLLTLRCPSCEHRVEVLRGTRRSLRSVCPQCHVRWWAEPAPETQPRGPAEALLEGLFPGVLALATRMGLRR